MNCLQSLFEFFMRGNTYINILMLVALEKKTETNTKTKQNKKKVWNLYLLTLNRNDYLPVFQNRVSKSVRSICYTSKASATPFLNVMNQDSNPRPPCWNSVQSTRCIFSEGKTCFCICSQYSKNAFLWQLDKFQGG